MVTIYTTSSCSSCRKAKKWFEEHNIEYKEINLFVKDISKTELLEILQRTELGTDEIVSKRSKIISENKIDVSKMTMNELVDFLIENPSTIKRPIIIDERHFQVGYNNVEIRAFIPKELRDMNCHDCFNFDDCDMHQGCSDA